MPANFPEIWESRVITLLTTSDVAPWLDNIPELDTDVYTLGENTATEKNIIHIPIETFSPDVLINNTTYPIEVQEFEDGTVQLTLDKYQTKATSISDDSAMGASYPKIDSATRGHRRQINTTKYKKAAHAIAPAANTASTPIIELPDNYTANDVYQAMVSVKDGFDKNEIPEDNRRFVMATDHYNKLLTDRERFGNLLVDHNTGKVNQQIAGFHVFTYVSNPKYSATTKAKLAWGAIADPEDKVGSFAFYVDNIGKKTGNTKQYFSPAASNPTTQTNLLNYRHYFIAMPVQNKAIGAII
ncbi:hypothetical protein HX004_14055 [Myroides sp. 1354]|uniref:phage major capsid protein n=1 Tax=unclassified Myroides TaxID=2642485 RepID=UPI0025782866|nr:MULTISPECIES: hypothetical protein [unclassified Myroides]MDM1045878.1 hypothetical protein [Myroides sp. R163-1]MDM1056888.1 hypothetical protein [Myroides sp. 1354]MDM1070083.1 hypothetical protein [Myroides sp. 1372]